MVHDVLEGLGVLAALFAAYPVWFTLGTVIVFTAIYFKWHWITMRTRNALRDAYAGWFTPGTLRGESLVMRPVKFLRIAFLTLAFFGGSAVFYWLVVLQDPGVTPKDWLVFAIFGAFSVAAFWMLWFSFQRIIVTTDQISRRGLFHRSFEAPLAELEAVTPISKTIAGGVYVQFTDGRRLRVIARMSGYRQMLAVLAQRDLKLRAQLNALAARGE